MLEAVSLLRVPGVAFSTLTTGLHNLFGIGCPFVGNK
jgi:hypothetical protein